MTIRTLALAPALAAGLALAACQSTTKGPAGAQGQGDAGKAPAGAQGAADMSPDEMMKRMQELGRPGDGHRRLQPIVGKWQADGKFWMDPSAPPTTTVGTTTNEWFLDGRFLRSHHEGEMMGKPFQGFGLTGYNNATGEYEGTWIDSMVTHIMPVSRGKADASGKVITFHREYDDPILRTRVKSREVLKIVDDDHHTFEWFQPGPGGDEMRLMLIEYTRIR